MLLIVAHHYVVNSGIHVSVARDPLSWRSLFLTLLGAWGKVGINCFVLITGYFMCVSRITPRKYVKLLCQIEFYKILFYAVFLAAGYEKLTLKSLLRVIVPIGGAGDFVSCFLLFYLLIPFWNILIRHMSERQHLVILGILLFIYTGLGTIPKVPVAMNYVIWFGVLYLLSSYVRLRPHRVFGRVKFWGTAAAVTFVVACLSVVAGTVLAGKLGKSGFRYSFWFVSDSNKILAVPTAFTAFMFFKNLRLKYSPLVNAAGASTFGVLLIHANSDAMRDWLWRDFLRVPEMYGSRYLVLHALCSVAGVFAVCAGLEYLRIRLLERPFLRWLDGRLPAWCGKFTRVWERFCGRFHIGGEAESFGGGAESLPAEGAGAESLPR